MAAPGKQCTIQDRPDPLNLFMLQTFLVVTVTRILAFLLRPLRLPRIIPELLAGLLLGPSGIAQVEWVNRFLYPTGSLPLLEALSNLGLMYFLFLVGLQMDFRMVKRTGSKGAVIGLCAMLVSFIVTTVLTKVTLDDTSEAPPLSHRMIIGIFVSVTAFPVLSRMVAELKLINTELGRIAISAGLIIDMSAWVMLVAAIIHGDPVQNKYYGISLAFGCIFFAFCIFVVRPTIYWIVKRTPEGEDINDIYICFILLGVLVCGFVTRRFGGYSVFGAFLYGLIIPSDPLAAPITAKLEDFVTGLLLPLFFTITGLRTNITMLNMHKFVGVMMFVIQACAAKIAVTLLIGTYYGMSLHEGLALGFLLNTKGLTELVIINIGVDFSLIDNSTYTAMVILTAISTIVMTGTIIAHNPTRRCVHYKQRTIQKSKQNSELPVLVCNHTSRTAPSMIALLEASHPTRKSPLSVHSLYLVELTDRESAMLIVNQSDKPSKGAINEIQAQGDHIFNAFRKYQLRNTAGVYLQTLTALSPHSTMHEDICIVAENRRIAFILLPFHKQQTVDGGMEVTNPAYRTINQNVLANAPCSVGILVDRGLAGPPGSSSRKSVVVFFFGGPDDREALAYAQRMAENPEVYLTVIQFLQGDEANESNLNSSGSKRETHLSVMVDSDNEKQRDFDFISGFKCSGGSISFQQKIVKNGEETVTTIRNMDHVYDLYIVGRSQGDCPLTAGLTDWSECPELGAVGDILASSDFPSAVSVLVVQQYMGYGLPDGLDTPDSSVNQSEAFTSMQNPVQTPKTEKRHLPHRSNDSDSATYCILL